MADIRNQEETTKNTENMGESEATGSASHCTDSAAEIARNAHSAIDTIYHLVKTIQTSQRKITVKVVDDVEIQLNKIRNAISSLANRAEASPVSEASVMQIAEKITAAVIQNTNKRSTIPQVSYANAAASQVTYQPSIPRKIDPVIIKPTGILEKKGLEEIKKKIQEKNKSIKVNWCKETASKTTIINVATQEDRTLLQETIKSIPELKEIESKKRLPKIVIHGVAKQVDEREFLNELAAKNFETITGDDIKVRYKTGHKTTSKNCSWIVQLPPNCWRTAITRGRLYADMQSFKVEEYNNVTRCYKCQRFGHTAAHCHQQNSTCFKCGGDHESKCCEEEIKLKCVNCIRKGYKGNDHNVNDKKCPVYIKALEMERNRTDYGP